MKPTEIAKAIRECTHGKDEVVLRDTTGERGSGSLTLVVRRYQQGVTAMWTGMWQQGGRRRKKQLGRHPEISLTDARALFATQVRDVLAAGRDPSAYVVMAPTDRPTFAELVKAYCDQMEADGKVSATEVRRALDLAAKAFGLAKLAGDILPEDVSAYLAKIYDRGSKVSADRTRSYLSAAFNFGLQATHDYRQDRRRDWGIKANPVTAVKKDSGASKARERALSAEELRRVWNAAGGAGFALETQAAVRLLIATGQRVQEVLRIEAHEVDLDAMVWNMPAHKTKGKKKPHMVPLPAIAKPVLAQLLSVHRRGLLMPGRTGQMIKHQVINKALGRWQASLDKKAKVEPFQTRDLRRTWKSRAHDAGIDRFTRDLIQQHDKGDTGSRHYDRADYQAQMAAAMTKWNDWLGSVLAERTPGALQQLGAVDAQAQV